MGDLSINDLPPELLTKVFRSLGAATKNATLTCKLWKNVIESAHRWSLTLKYRYDGQRINSRPYTTERKINFLLTTNRKFGTITIKWGRLGEDDQIPKMIHRLGFNVVKLILHQCHIVNLATFAELLNLTPNLKHAVVHEIHLRGESDAPLDPLLPDLKKLKNLEMVNCGEQILKCFRKAKLTTMKITEGAQSKHWPAFVDFLSSQAMLTSLTVGTDSSSHRIVVALGKLCAPIPFRLTQLDISNTFKGESWLHHDNVLRFVKSQAENLKQVAMGCNISSSVYNCIFADMTNLSTLSVKVGHIPQDSGFYERLQENRAVRTIKLQDFPLGETAYTPFLGDFLRKLPNIRNLSLPYTRYVNNNILVMAQHLSKLESLHIDFIDERSIDCVKFPNLKALHIERLCGKINWNEFTKFHAGLSELTIQGMENRSFLTSDDIDEITTNVDLRSIRLGIGFVADDRFFQIIRAQCTHLKVLDLHKVCILNGLRNNGAISVLRLLNNI